MKRLPLVLLLVLSVLAGCTSHCGPRPCPAPPAPAAPAPAPVAGAGPWNLTVFHINDMHAMFLPEPATWRADRAETGGIVALYSQLAEQRAAAPASILLDAGDFMTGNPVCEIEADGVLGGGWLAMMNALDIDAGVIGNHDFDLGRPNARALAAASDHPVMALDLLNEAGGLELPDGPVVLERGGLRIGVIGVTCDGLFDVTAESRVAGLRLDDQDAVVRRWARELDPDTDLLIALTHNGVQGDTLLARDLAGSGVDLIVGGHSHTRLTEPLLIGGILVVQAGSKVKELGRLDLQVADDRIVSYAGRLVELPAAGSSAAPELEALVADYAAQVDEQYGRVIGELASPWRRSGRGESNMGSWICDRMLEAAGADVALLNSGTLRKDFDPGPLTLLDIHSMVPFSNTLETFTLDGAALQRIARFNAEAAEADSHGILQIGGLRYVYTVRDGAVEVLEATVGGEPVDPARVYTVACPDYVAQKAELYMDMARPDTKYAGYTITEVVVDAVRAAGRIVSEKDGRMTRR